MNAQPPTPFLPPNLDVDIPSPPPPLPGIDAGVRTWLLSAQRNENREPFQNEVILMNREELVDKVNSLCTDLSSLDFADDGFLDRVNELYPVDGESVTALRDLATSGFDEGWLTPRSQGAVQFGRLVKPSAESSQFSCDAVYMPSCPGPKHSHPEGELNLCIAMDGEPRFDDSGPGWCHYSPGTTHIPTVTGGTMLILYFLPNGAIEWCR